MAATWFGAFFDFPGENVRLRILVTQNLIIVEGLPQKAQLTERHPGGCRFRADLFFSLCLSPARILEGVYKGH